MNACPEVLRVADVGADCLSVLLHTYGLNLRLMGELESIPGSFWGEPEAGIIGTCVYARGDTPVHSVLHETGHLICACDGRRAVLRTDAGSDDAEETAVCYLQILLSDSLPGVGRDRLMRDMDSWGYSFRQGSSRAWFNGDAADALWWLQTHGVVDNDGRPSWKLRK